MKIILFLSAIILLTAVPTSAFAATVNASIVPGATTKTTDAYDPYPIEINKGDEVIWTNNDSALHTVTSGSNGEPTGLFGGTASAPVLMPPKKTLSYTFEKRGTYDYFCILHPAMVGQVIVTGSDTTPVTSITVMTDKQAYTKDDSITISGDVDPIREEELILLKVVGPADSIARFDGIAVDEDGSYTYTFQAGGAMKNSGTYTVSVTYADATATTTFEYDANETTPTIPLSFSEISLVDIRGDSVSELKVNSLALLTASVTNHSNQKQSFMAIFGIFNEDDVTLSYQFQKGTIVPNDTVELGVSYIPDNSGTIRVKVFAVTDFDNPTLLSNMVESSYAIRDAPVR